MRALDLVFAARPMLHVPIWSIYLVSLKYHNDLAGEHFDWRDVATLVCLSLLAAGAYYLNQIFDVASDTVNRKLGFLTDGKLVPGQLMLGYLITSLAALVGGWYLSRITFAILLQLFALGFAYSAPPFRMKDRAFWGFAANTWGIGFLVSFSVMPNINFHNAGLLGWDNPWYFAAAIGGIYLLTTIPDMAGDELAGKRTAAVVLGEAGALILGAVLLVLSAYLGFRNEFILLGSISVAAAGLAAIALIVKRREALKLAIVLPIVLLTLLAGVFYPVYLLFIVVLVILTRVYYRRRLGITYPSLTR